MNWYEIYRDREHRRIASKTPTFIAKNDVEKIEDVAPYHYWVACSSSGEEQAIITEDGTFTASGVIGKGRGLFITGKAPDNTCPYCGNTGTNTNLRGGIECAGCGHPR